MCKKKIGLREKGQKVLTWQLTFMAFKAEVELQLGKKIKAVKFDRGGEYYGRYDGSGEKRQGPFAKYLEECGIVPPYIMLGKPSMNSVAER
ncbi:Retrovirus-related Pol polyprotein from transposon TNT 1-94 [Cucumis melo var. makuwa]|uniref:Retrovirus-related Pol polyprotein from transposon TNT 1-94 n=1 Tax=Cucumis melo var. makuwa TaxID=1194695 RepID=A0A5A7T5U6_CUCMM|nr:Retrovirus-related Pol polyprotein from transposon TNT 1-94 [Cucumis melo var. makuwa]TYJ96002.1 Retrovirus-related Pol polyprotein from transposon TNT 1-94 [Cucumis melo var. makuwa]